MAGLFSRENMLDAVIEMQKDTLLNWRTLKFNTQAAEAKVIF